MLAMRYKRSHERQYLFIKHSTIGGMTTLVLYVDDISVTGNDSTEENLFVSVWLEGLRLKNLGS